MNTICGTCKYIQLLKGKEERNVHNNQQIPEKGICYGHPPNPQMGKFARPFVSLREKSCSLYEKKETKSLS